MFGKHIGIDLGTANVLVYVKGKGIVLNEPSVVAYSASDNRVVAVGTKAKEMLGRTPGRITVTRPMRDGVIADYLITEAMIRSFIKTVCGRFGIFKPVVMICIPAGVTNVESRAVMDATIQAGAKEAIGVIHFDQPLERRDFDALLRACQPEDAVFAENDGIGSNPSSAPAETLPSQSEGHLTAPSAPLLH